MLSRQITFSDVLKMFLAHIKLIIIITLIATILAFCYVSFFVTPVYSTSALILVQNDSSFQFGNGSGSSSSQSGDMAGERVNTSDIDSSVKLANTCSILFTQDPDMKTIIAGNAVSIAAVEDSYFLRINTRSSDPQTAANVANRVAQEAPIVFQKYFGDAGKVDTVDKAAVPSRPSSPSVPRYVVIGFIVGLIISLVISFLLEIIDTTIKPSDDLYKMYDVPVFAEIIDFDQKGGAK